jgi:hypothetical protein
LSSRPCAGIQSFLIQVTGPRHKAGVTREKFLKAE